MAIGIALTGWMLLGAQSSDFRTVSDLVKAPPTPQGLDRLLTFAVASDLPTRRLAVSWLGAYGLELQIGEDPESSRCKRFVKVLFDSSANRDLELVRASLFMAEGAHPDTPLPVARQFPFECGSVSDSYRFFQELSSKVAHSIFLSKRVPALLDSSSFRDFWFVARRFLGVAPDSVRRAAAKWVDSRDSAISDLAAEIILLSQPNISDIKVLEPYFQRTAPDIMRAQGVLMYAQAGNLKPLLPKVYPHFRDRPWVLKVGFFRADTLVDKLDGLADSDLNLVAYSIQEIAPTNADIAEKVITAAERLLDSPNPDLRRPGAEAIWRIYDPKNRSGAELLDRYVPRILNDPSIYVRATLAKIVKHLDMDRYNLVRARLIADGTPIPPQDQS